MFATPFRFNMKNAEGIFSEFFGFSSPFGGGAMGGGDIGGSRASALGFLRAKFNEDIFAQFRGAGGGEGSRYMMPRKAATIERNLPCSLEDLYRGTTKKMKISRDVLDVSRSCSPLSGIGLRDIGVMFLMVEDNKLGVIGKETRKKALEKWGGKPDVLVACVGGGSNAMGLFHEFVNVMDFRLIGVEAAGFGLDSGKHAATLTKGEVGVLHGAMSYLLQDEDGQIIEPHSISAGLDYIGVGPEHSFLKDEGRAEYYCVTDEEALEAFKRLSLLEGIIPALETSHALAYLEKLCPTLPDGTKLVLNCSGRGDKDVHTAIKHLQV